MYSCITKNNADIKIVSAMRSISPDEIGVLNAALPHKTQFELSTF